MADIGGLPVAGGGRFRHGLLYRISGALVGPTDLAHLQALGLRLVVDLRGSAEDRTRLSGWADDYGVVYRHQPVTVGAAGQMADLLRQAGPSVEAATAVLRSIYREILDEHGGALSGAISLMAGNLPAGFGCAAGKDRTGILAALLQTLAGMSENDVVADYIALAPDVDRLRTVLEDWETPAGVDLTAPGIDTLLSATDEIMRDALAHLAERWGGAAAYLRAHGLAAEDIEELRNRLVETG
ncbi:MAG: tyrosine-protein phosphatase [bacterium]